MSGIMRRLLPKKRSRASEEGYRIGAETASDAIIMIDEESRILYVNPAAEKIFGHSVEEMMGQSLTMLMPEYLRHLHRGGLKSYVETGRKHISWQAVELHGLHKSGQEIMLELSFGEFSRDGQRFFTGVARDVTERKRVERRQAAQYAVTRSLAESAMVADAARSILQSICEQLDWEMGILWHVDRRRGGLRCVDIWHRPESEADEFAAQSRESSFARDVGLPGRVWAEAAPVWVNDVASDELFQRRASAMKEQLRSAFGFPILIRGEVIGVMEFFSRQAQSPDEALLEMMSAMGHQLGQFIERKRAETELHASEAQYRYLADAMPQIVWTARADGYFDYYNRRWFEYTGMTMEQTKGWGWQPVLHPDDAEKCLRRWARSIVTGEDYQIEYRFRRASDGQYRWHLGRAAPMRNVDGEVVKWFGTCTDIHDQKRAEETARASNRARDNFLATLSHELRTPLTPVIGWLHMMRSGMIPASDFGRGLAIIDNNSHTLLRIINDLLDMSAIMSGKMRIESLPVSLHSALREAVESAKVEAGARGISIELTDCDEDEVTVIGDRARLTQIFSNLLNNAVRFSPDAASVRVKCEANGAEQRISIEDDGQGIRADFMPHVFERFRQADESKTRAHGGLGIGLALVKSFVETHGGRVAAESAGLNQGSRFIVDLPRFETPALPANATKTGGEDSAATTTNARLLLVEDAEDTLTLLQTALGARGYLTTPCASASEALRVAAGMSFDLIVSDIGLPQMDGHQLLKRLREMPHLRDVPAIALSGYAAAKDATAALDAGFNLHLAKPIEPSELVNAIEQLLRKG
jgi:PAS domain S-box-containing protein